MGAKITCSDIELCDLIEPGLCTHVNHIKIGSTQPSRMISYHVKNSSVDLCGSCHEIIKNIKIMKSFGKCESQYHECLKNPKKYHQNSETILFKKTSEGKWYCHHCISIHTLIESLDNFGC